MNNSPKKIINPRNWNTNSIPKILQWISRNSTILKNTSITLIYYKRNGRNSISHSFWSLSTHWISKTHVGKIFGVVYFLRNKKKYYKNLPPGLFGLFQNISLSFTWLMYFGLPTANIEIIERNNISIETFPCLDNSNILISRNRQFKLFQRSKRDIWKSVI